MTDNLNAVSSQERVTRNRGDNSGSGRGGASSDTNEEGKNNKNSTNGYSSIAGLTPPSAGGSSATTS